MKNRHYGGPYLSSVVGDGDPWGVEKVFAGCLIGDGECREI